MKKILLLATFLAGFTAFAQYEDEIKLLNTACSSDLEELNEVFDGLESAVDQGVYLYANDIRDYYYVITEMDGMVVASYVESYDRGNLKAMEKSVDNSSPYYYYVVTASRKDDVILITSTKK